MKIKVLLCNCKGLCASFRNTDMNTLPFQIESELDVQYTVLHPQLCGQGGNEALMDAMKTADSETYILCGACAPEAQEKLFKKVMRLTGFPTERFIPVDIRQTDNDGILNRLREKVEELVKQAEQKAKTETGIAAIGLAPSEQNEKAPEVEIQPTPAA
jgi:heterodisulfide reductase subunit A-like polyferredoxin